MKKNIYEVEKNIEKVLRGGNTGFLVSNVSKEVQKKLRKSEYQIFKPYPDAEKIIIFGGKPPRVRLYRIECYENDHLQHSSILGSLFGLNITGEMFGDIVLYERNFYFYVLEDIGDFILEHFTMVGNFPIKLVEMEQDYLEAYERCYEEIELIVVSERIDVIIARIIGCNRDKVQEKVKNKLILLNGEILKRSSWLLREGDIFSIKGFGKYCYCGIKGVTKKKHYVVLIKKYV